MSKDKVLSPASPKETPRSLINFDSLPDSAYVRVGTVAGLFDCSVVTVWRKSKRWNNPKTQEII